MEVPGSIASSGHPATSAATVLGPCAQIGGQGAASGSEGLFCHMVLAGNDTISLLLFQQKDAACPCTGNASGLMPFGGYFGVALSLVPATLPTSCKLTP